MSFTDSDGNTYSTIYDQDGKITEFRNPDATRMLLSYDSKGLVANVVNPDGSEITYSYDSDDKMVSFTVLWQLKPFKFISLETTFSICIL